MRISRWTIAPLLLMLVSGVWLAADGRMHWDEPHYLYCGSYLTVGELVEGDVQPTGAPNYFNFGRILYILTVKAFLGLTGPGFAGFALLVAVNAALLLLGVFLIGRMMRALLPGVNEWRWATVLLSISPVILYMVFKGMPDNQALVAAIVATYGLLRVARGGNPWWTVLAAVGLAVAVLTKSQGTFLYAGFWVAAVLLPIGGIDRRRVAIFGIAGGAAALLLCIVILEWLGVGVARYLAAFRDALGGGFVPFFFVVYCATELGVLWLLLPLALLSPRQREVRFMGVWFVVATAPFVLVFYEQIEPRHIMVNLAAATGLFALALEVLRTRLTFWLDLSQVCKSVVASILVLVVMGTNWLALTLMPYEIELKPLTAMLGKLDARYGAGNYTVLAPWTISEFYTIRDIWPGVDVRTVELMTEDGKPEHEPRRDLRDLHHQGRNIESLDELSKVHRPLVFLGMQRRFGADAIDVLQRASPSLGARLTKRFQVADQLYTADSRWFWGNPRVHLQPIGQVGHYYAFEAHLPGQ